MKIASWVATVLIFCIDIVLSAQWMGATTPAAPKVQLVESQHHAVIFDIEVPGIWICQTDSGTNALVGESEVHPTHDPNSLPTISTLIAVPRNSTVTASLENARYRSLEMPLTDRIMNLRIDDPLASDNHPIVSDPAVMRGLTVVSVTVPAVRIVNGQWERIESGRVRLTISGGAEAKPRTSLCTEGFCQLWNAVVLNSGDLLDPVVPIPGAYLFICPDNAISFVQPLVQWKLRSGHPVRVAGLSETGSTTTSIAAYIANAYNTWDIPPEYVVLIGDVEGTYDLPTFFITGTGAPWDCTDLPYTLIEGNDYFPEMLIGRFSVSNATELQVMVNKVLSYEKSPYVGGADWFERGLVAANAQNFPPYVVMTSSRLTKLWVRDMMLSSGFQAVDTVFYPAQQSPQLVSNSINTGVSFVNYRGYGEYQGWSGPDYSVQNIYNELNNAHMLPVVTSIVCGGGNFAYETSVCFGEAWTRVGTSSAPRGAVAFVGPSEINTKTWFNNCIDGGIYWGIFHDNLPTLGQALLRGKLEAYIQFPFYHAAGNSYNSVHFYYHVYNILGDPGLRLWTACPTPMIVDHPTQIPAGTNSISVSVSSEGLAVPEARVALATADSLLAVVNTDSSGAATLVMNPVQGDSVWITVTARNRIPYLATISVVQASQYVALDSYTINDDNTPPSQGNGDGFPNPGERLEITVTGRNTGTTSLSNVTVVFRGPDVLDSTASLGTIPVGGISTASTPFVVDIPMQAHDGDGISYSAVFLADTSEWQSALRLDIRAPEPQFVSYRALDSGNGILDPGEQSNVTMTFTNAGSMASGNSTVSVRSLSSCLEISDSVAAAASIDPGDSLEMSGDVFTMRASEALFPGEPAQLSYHWVQENGWSDSGMVTMVLGIPGQGDPTAPDAYGYRAYDNGDSGYVWAPVYDWMELNPALGGPGSNTGIRDTVEGADAAVFMDLPFPFTFYGESYTRITICSNGWIGMGETPMISQLNWGIPSAQSPPAMIAGFWDDLYQPTGAGIFTYNDAMDHRFITEYSLMVNVTSGSWETFQIILFDPAFYPTLTDDGIIKFQYQEVHDNDGVYNYATVGIQRPNPRMGVQYSYFNSLAPGAAPLVAGRAIQFVAGGYATGPNVHVTAYRIDDDNFGGSSGNGNGEINNAETIELWVGLRNIGSATASGVTGVLESTDSCITLLDTLGSFGTIEPQDTSWSMIPFRFSVHGDIPNDHRIGFSLQIQDNQGHYWVSPFGLTAQCPMLAILSVAIDDDATGQSQGNGNGEFNPGETVELSFSIRNNGSNRAVNTQAILRTGDPLVTLVDSLDEVGTIEAGDSIITGWDFAFTLSSSAQDGDSVSFGLFLQDSTGTNFTLPFALLVKDFLVFYHHKNLSDPAPGNNNGYADPGETVAISLILNNPDLGTATGITAEVTVSDPYFSSLGGLLTFPDLPGDSDVTSLNTFSVTVDDSCPNPYRGVFYVHITADEGYADADSFHLTAGKFRLMSDFDGDFPNWTHGGSGDLWDTTGIDFVSFDKSLYCGNKSTLLYPNSSSATVFSSTFSLSPEYTLVFDHKYDFSDTDYGKVMMFTGSGNVELARYFGSSGGWQRVVFPLWALTPTNNTRVFFGISTNGSGTAQGWWLDNVMIVRDYPSESVADRDLAIPKIYYLDTAYPNPFNEISVIPFGVPEPSHVVIEVYNVLGQLVGILEDSDHSPGNYRIRWEARTVGSGVYFIRMQANTFSKVRKIVLLK
jgi:hypothetical protein